MKFKIKKKKTIQITNVGEDMEKRDPWYTVDGHVNWCSHCGKQYGCSSKKLKIEPPYDPGHVVPTPSHSWVYIQRKRNINSKRYMYPYVH